MRVGGPSKGCRRLGSGLQGHVAQEDHVHQEDLDLFDQSSKELKRESSVNQGGHSLIKGPL